VTTYEKTHPWITFNVDLSERPHPKLWLLLGEARSKCEHVAGVPLRPQTAKDFNQLYLAKGVAATTAIEGNTLSEAQVLQQIEGTLKLPPSKEYLAREIQNVVAECNRIWDDAFQNADGALTAVSIKSFNRSIQAGLPLGEGVVPGEFRHHSVGVEGARYRGAPHEECDLLIDRLCSWLNGENFVAKDDTMRMPMAILKAVLAHIYLAWIHPFGDGNGRTARLVEFFLLVHAGVPMPAAHLLSNHYNETRSAYYAQLAHASRSGGDVIPFIVYAVEGFVDGLRAQLATIRDEQWDIIWGSFVFRKFAQLRTPSDTRRRDLVLDLSAHAAPVPVPKLTGLTPRTARSYAGKTTKTLRRDLNALEVMGLIRRTREGYVATREQVLSFLPAKKGERPQASAALQATVDVF
jgi:Fic family protein